MDTDKNARDADVLAAELLALCVGQPMLIIAAAIGRVADDVFRFGAVHEPDGTRYGGRRKPRGPFYDTDLDGESIEAVERVVRRHVGVLCNAGQAWTVAHALARMNHEFWMGTAREIKLRRLAKERPH